MAFEQAAVRRAGGFRQSASEGGKADVMAAERQQRREARWRSG